MGAGVGLGARLWIVGGEVGVGARLDCVDEVGLGARLWIVGARVGLGARLWIVGARVGLGARRGLHRRGLDWGEAVDCVGGMTVMRRYRNCVKRRCGKKVRKVANL